MQVEAPFPGNATPLQGFIVCDFCGHERDRVMTNQRQSFCIPCARLLLEIEEPYSLIDTYQSLAARTLRQDLGERGMLVNMALGITGEGGEFADAVKKHVFHSHAIDKKALAKEVGDVLWYLANAAGALGYSLSEIAETNIEKLKARYPNGFSSEASINRSE